MSEQEEQGSLLDYGQNEEPPKEEETPPPESGEQETPEEEAAVETEASEDEDSVELSSLDQLPEVLKQYDESIDLDSEALFNLSVPVKVNHETKEVPLAELKASYEIGQATRQELEEAKERASKIIEEANQHKESFVSTAQTMGKLLESVEQEINRDEKNIDWNKLRTDDPAEWTAKRDEIRERRDRLEKLKKEASETWENANQVHQHQVQQQLDARLPEERKKLLERVPEWEDDEKAKNEKQEVIQYLANEGFDQNQLKIAAYNGSLLAMAIKAMRYDKSRSKAGDIKKKMVRVPKKTMKPGSKSQDKPQPNGADQTDPVRILYG